MGLVFFMGLTGTTLRARALGARRAGIVGAGAAARGGLKTQNRGARRWGIGNVKPLGAHGG